LIIGAWIALRFRPSSRIVGIVMGFGAGALIAAVAYELIPESSPRDFPSFIALGLGAVAFFIATSLIDKRSKSKGTEGDSAQAQTGKIIVLGALLDGIPESLVLGMSLFMGDAISVAFLGAVIVSNLPESISATSEMDRGGVSRRKIYTIWRHYYYRRRDPDPIHAQPGGNICQGLRRWRGTRYAGGFNDARRLPGRRKANRTDDRDRVCLRLHPRTDWMTLNMMEPRGDTVEVIRVWVSGFKPELSQTIIFPIQSKGNAAKPFRFYYSRN
jgi:hypothetical protein